MKTKLLFAVFCLLFLGAERGVRYDTATNQVLGITTGPVGEVWPEMSAGEETATIETDGIGNTTQHWSDGVTIRDATAAEVAGWKLGHAKSRAKDRVDAKTVRLFSDFLASADNTTTLADLLAALKVNANAGRAIKARIDAAATVEDVTTEENGDQR